MSESLAGRRVALAEGRQLEELARLLEAEGAVPLRFPMLDILDAADDGPVVAWLRDLIAGRFDWVILLTGEGVRRLAGCAERHGLHDEYVAALGRAKTISRGPKPVQALRPLGVAPTLVAKVPTTPGVVAALRDQPLDGKTVGVQLYAPANEPLLEFLQGAGAAAVCVLPYVYAPASDAERVVELIDGLADGTVDVITFTSAPQVVRLFEVAGERDATQRLREGLARAKVAAVGPVMRAALEEHKVRVDVCPEAGFVMKNLVLQMKKRLGG